MKMLENLGWSGCICGKKNSFSGPDPSWNPLDLGAKTLTASLSSGAA